ncbi:MAG: hypothetical protein ACYCOU_01225 [Sulfobacillus sp.]
MLTFFCLIGSILATLIGWPLRHSGPGAALMIAGVIFWWVFMFRAIRSLFRRVIRFTKRTWEEAKH